MGIKTLTSATLVPVALILGKDAGSKYDKARKLNITIITEEDYRKIIES